MALVRCRECGQMISEQAQKCPNCGCPTFREPFQYQGGYTQPYQNNDNQTSKWLYAIIGVLLAFVVLGAILLISNASKDNDEELQAEQVEKTNQETVGDATATAQQNTVQEVKKEVPVQQTTPPPPKQTYVAPQNIVLSGVLNGDYVTFNLTANGSSVRGQFYNSAINVSFSVKGTLTGSSLSLRSTNHGKWRFSATKSGGSYRGYATNGSVTYGMEVQ